MFPLCRFLTVVPIKHLSLFVHGPVPIGGQGVGIGVAQVDVQTGLTIMMLHLGLGWLHLLRLWRLLRLRLLGLLGLNGALGDVDGHQVGGLQSGGRAVGPTVVRLLH